MRYLFWLSALLNLAFIITISMKTETLLEPALAKIAVRETLEQMSVIPAAGEFSNMTSCAEQNGTNASVIGKGAVRDQTASENGEPITRNFEFSYQARVANHCDRFNYLCYDVDRIDLRGTATTAARF
jgi:hypothetical protein